MTIADITRGRWPDLLSELAGLTAEQLTDKHQPCPCCGGTDRYRFDDLDGTGSWFCNQCGGKDGAGGAGSGMDLLLRVTGWQYPEACRRIEQHLHLIPDPPTDGAEHVWPYGSGFLVCRFPGKKIRPLWWDGTTWIWKAPPAPRPLYRLDALRQHPDAPVLIVEGEKTADAAQLLFPSAVAITWPSGCKATAKADWSPLANRRCVLWPDADDVGREAMAKLVPRLHAVGVEQVRIVHPPADVPDGWDLADATWTPAEAAAYLAANRTEPIKPPPTPEPVPVALAEPSMPQVQVIPDNAPFTCLGFDADAYYYQPTNTGQVTRLSRSSHTGTNLCALAELPYWETLYPSKAGVNWTAAASSLFAKQASIGVYSPDRVRGRGAWWDQGRAVLHLGDRLLVDGISQPVMQRVIRSSHLYERLHQLNDPTQTAPLTDGEGAQLLHIADRFHWDVPASGLLLAGWVTLAPICGALPWRPHAWLTAAAGSGKSAILDRYVTPLLGDMGLIVSGNTTEPGIRQALRADARPVVFDEAESNERNDQTRMQAILSLARVASSESRAHTLKGSPEGDVQRYTIRSMFLMASIATSLKQGADKSRFAQLSLRPPHEIPKDVRTAHWDELDRDLDRYISDDIGCRLQARTIQLIPVIRASIKVFTRIAAERFDSQRLGDQYGTLLAGAWSLISSQVATDHDACTLIDQNNWEPYSQATEVPDERRCIQRILQHQVRVEADKVITRSIGELVDIALHRQLADPAITRELAEATLGRHGLKTDGDAVLISNSAEAIAAILRDTSWSNCWPTVLQRLPGAAKAGVTYFRGAGTSSRAVRIPLLAIDSNDLLTS
jgi:putative DNA primase/helicase